MGVKGWGLGIVWVYRMVRSMGGEVSLRGGVNIRVGTPRIPTTLYPTY